MLKNFLCGMAVLLIGSTAYACDLCNCYLGINPNYNQNTIGFRFRDRSYFGEHSHENSPLARLSHHITSATGTDPQALETYQTYELWGRWYPFKKVQVQASLPISNNTQTETGEAPFNAKGLGDAMVMAQYQLFNTIPADDVNFRQRCFAGGGMKFPTGAYNKIAAGESLDPHMQVGTGSFDYLGVVTYMLKYKSFGYSTDVTYKINTVNDNGFQFANRLNANGTFFYQKKVGTVDFIPGIGAYYEQAGNDKSYGIKQVNTGGTALLASGGLDTYYKHFSLNLHIQLPVTEDLYGKQAKGKNRYIVGINYSF